MTNNLYAKFSEVFHNNFNKSEALISNGNFTNQNIDAASAQVANALYKLGLKQGDIVAVQIEKSAYNLFLYLACLRSGIIYLPLNTGYTLNELSYFFKDTTPQLVICDPSQLSAISDLSKSIDIPYQLHTLDKDGKGTLREISENENKEFQTVHSNPDDIAVILYTSGTTGNPKGAMITHSSLYHNAFKLNEIWGITNQDTILHSLPLFHVHGLFFATHTALLSGAKLIFLPKFDADTVIENIPKSTVFMGVPTYYKRLIDDPRIDMNLCKKMRLFISGSAPLLESTFENFHEKTGHIILERYGMTETGINTSNPLRGKRKVGTVGLPLPGVSARVVNEKGKILKTKEVGNIQIRGNNLFKGYWRMPDKTSQDFTEDGYFKTGDLGFFDEEGYLSIVGREKDLVITGGLNVYPKEIELTINTIPGIVESAVIGLPHPDFGEAVTAVIVAQENAETNELSILSFIKSHHANFKVPKRILFAPELPKNTMGKVQKNILREKYKDIYA